MTKKIKSKRAKGKGFQEKYIVFLVCVLLVGMDCYSADWTASSDSVLASGYYYFDTLTVNCTLTCLGNTSTNTGVVISCTNLIINAGYRISANGNGYPAGQGPGTKPGTVGGSYGGYGGDGAVGSTLYYSAEPYGALKSPTDLGSGGSSGAGGGAITLIVQNELKNYGTICADGTNATNGGGGSGGSVFIRTKILSGSGQITSIGGDWGGSYVYGGGGGGRIAVYCDTNNFSGTVLARRGDGGSPSAGSCGTIYAKSSQQPNGDLIMDGANYVNGYYAPISGNNTFDTITLKAGGNCEIVYAGQCSVSNIYSDSIGNKIKSTGALYLPKTFCDSYFRNVVIQSNGGLNIPDGNLTIWDSGTLEFVSNYLTLNNLTIKPNGKLTHLANTDSQKRYWINLTVNNNLTIDSGGYIDITGKGYPAGCGPGAGTTARTGGSHGGKGTGNGIPGDTYGSETMPGELGSGGNALPGGGAVYLLVWGTLRLDGQILATGVDNYFFDMGTGSGGSVYIRTPTFTGNSSGRINVKGGYSVVGGHGGGGRIAVYYDTNNYSGTYVLSGGTAGDTYNGTLYMKEASFHLAPEIPAIDNPSYSSPIPGKRPSFVWTASKDEENDTLQFEIEITQDSSFADAPAVSALSSTSATGFEYSTNNGISWQNFPETGVSSNANPAVKVRYTVQQDLWVGYWYWRVRAGDIDGYSSWSEKGYLPSIIGDLVVRISSPQDSSIVYSEKITVEGVVEQSVSQTITVNGTVRNLSVSDGKFSVEVDLIEGKNEIVVTGNGVLGNYLSDTVAVWRLKTPESTGQGKVGANGGTIRLEDWDGDKENDSRIEIDQGVFDREVTVTITALSGDVPVYEVKTDKPDNDRLKRRVKIILSYRSMKVDGKYEGQLKIFHWDGVKWQAIGSEVNKTKKVISCYVSHFSKYAVMRMPNSEGDAVSVSPAVFTPNSDGINDFVVFNVIARENGKMEILIFDSVGKIVRNISEDNIGAGTSVYWDGLDANFNPSETGLYLYYVYLSAKIVSSGTVVIAR